MHAVLLFVSLFAVSSAASDCGLVQIVLYPYYHDPEPAWRITIHGDGDVRFEEVVGANKDRLRG